MKGRPFMKPILVTRGIARDATGQVCGRTWLQRVRRREWLHTVWMKGQPTVRNTLYYDETFSAYLNELTLESIAGPDGSYVTRAVHPDDVQNT